MARWFPALVTIGALTGSACGGEPSVAPAPRDPAPPVPSPQPSPPTPAPAPPSPAPEPREVDVRLMHVAALHAKAALPVRIGNDATAAPVPLAFGAPATPARATANREGSIEVSWEGGTARSHAAADGEQRVLMLVYSRDPEEDAWSDVSPGAARHSASNGGLDVASAPDRTDAPTAGTIRVRFVNALIGERRIDVCPTPDGPEPIFPLVHYGWVEGMHAEDRPAGEVRWVEVPAASSPRWEVRRGELDAPCRGRSLGFFTLPSALGGQNVTLILAGRSRGAPRRQLWACSDPPAAPACAPVPLR